MAGDFSCLTIDPRNPMGEKVAAIFPAELTIRYYKYAPTRYYNLITAKFVLECTERVFSGIREFDEGGWCYTAVPATWYIREDVKASFPERMVYAVYLNPNMRVYECRAEHAALDDPRCPRDWKERYRGLIWKSTF